MLLYYYPDHKHRHFDQVPHCIHRSAKENVFLPPMPVRSHHKEITIIFLNNPGNRLCGSAISDPVIGLITQLPDILHIPLNIFLIAPGFKIPDFSAQIMRPGRRSEEHTSELQSLMRISYAVFCLKQKTKKTPTEIKTIQLQHTTNIA